MSRERLEDARDSFVNRARDTWGWLSKDVTAAVKGFPGNASGRPASAQERAEQALEKTWQKTSRTLTSEATMRGVAWLGLGAVLIYYLDPYQGRRRRALARNQLVHLGNELTGALQVGSRDLAHRSQGLVAEARKLWTDDRPSDSVLTARVRSAMGRVVSNPGAIDVHAHDGQVILSGAILEREHQALLTTVSSVRGVRDLVDQLQGHEHPGLVPALQGADDPSAHPYQGRQENWSPAQRLLAGSAGLGLFSFGIRQRGLSGTALSLLGAGMMARAAANRPLNELIGLNELPVGEPSRDELPLEVRSSISIKCPLDDVFVAWADYRNFPRFIPRIREVINLGGRRSQWTVEGLTGTLVQWTSEITEYVPNRRIAWRSNLDTTLPNAGVVDFQSFPGGGTQVNVHVFFQIPGGLPALGFARMMKLDPKSLIDDHLRHLKDFLEEGCPESDHNPPTEQAKKKVPRHH